MVFWTPCNFLLEYTLVGSIKNNTQKLTISLDFVNEGSKVNQLLYDVDPERATRGDSQTLTCAPLLSVSFYCAATRAGP
jgi:hypothetical protein